ncbi:MAG: hypothetical protein V1736_03555 [Pseudomonadota bacterium]
MKPSTGKKMWTLLVVGFFLALGVTSVQAQRVGQGTCPAGAADTDSAIKEQKGASPQAGSDSDSAMMDRDEAAPQTGMDMGAEMGTEESAAQPGPAAEPMATHAGPQTGMPQVTAPIDQDEARMLMQNYINALNDPNLKLGNIREKDIFYEGSVMRKNRAIDKVIVNRNTGTVYSTSIRGAHRPQAGTGMDTGAQTGTMDSETDASSPMRGRCR